MSGDVCEDIDGDVGGDVGGDVSGDSGGCIGGVCLSVNYFQIRHIYYGHHILITYTTPISQTYRVPRTVYVVQRCL